LKLALLSRIFVIRDTVVFNPGVRADKPVGKTANVSFPVADEEVNIVRSIALRTRQHCGLRPASSATTQVQGELR